MIKVKILSLDCPPFDSIDTVDGPKPPSEGTKFLGILKLRLDYKKYQKYRSIVASVFEPSSRTENWLSTEPEQIFGEVREKLLKEKAESHASGETVRFCLGFALESILRWESVQRETWYESIFRTFGLIS